MLIQREAVCQIIEIARTGAGNVSELMPTGPSGYRRLLNRRDGEAQAAGGDTRLEAI
jgi:hypothetical protein